MLDKSLKEFTQLASSKAPVPGGGGVSGLVGSLAASLAEMVTNLTAGKKKYQEYEAEIQDIMQETEQLRVLLLESINKDAEAFAPLAQAYGMDKEAEGYLERMENCLKEAAPSVMLAHGAMYGGAVNVFVNTRLMKDREYADKIDEEVNGLLSEYGPRALNCYQKVWERLKG